MNEISADKLFNAAVYLAYKSHDNPDDSTVLSLFGWLVHCHTTAMQALN